MTDEQLRSALIEAQDYMLNQFPTQEWHYEFSARFHRKMKMLIEREKHPIWHYVRRVVAIVAVLVGITGALLFGINGKVRAEVIRWIMEFFAENEYRYQKDSEIDIDVTQCTLEENIIEGYHLIIRKEDKDSICEVYRNEGGKQLAFYAISSTKEKDFYLMFDKRTQRDDVYVNGIRADVYLPESADDNCVIILHYGSFG